jgi:uncharacterized small protein (DUF1192 family)
MQDDEEVNQSKRLERPLLDPLSVRDLQAYISELRGEIARAEAAIAAKQGALGYAESFFLKKKDVLF